MPAKKLKDILGKKNPLLKSKFDQDVYKKNTSNKVTKNDNATENDKQFSADIKTYKRSDAHMGHDEQPDTVSDGEGLCELSKKTLASYKEKAHKQSWKLADKMESGKGSESDRKKMIKRTTGAARAGDRIDSKYYDRPKFTKEETLAESQAKRIQKTAKAVNKKIKSQMKKAGIKLDEVALAELSKKTLGSYIKKASRASANAAAQMVDHSNKGRHKDAGSSYVKSDRRQRGVDRATDKLTKEEVVAELSKKTLHSYVKKAAEAGPKHGKRATMFMARGDTQNARKAYKKSDNRADGINRAYKKIMKEDEVNELSKKTLKNYVGKSVIDYGDKRAERAKSGFNRPDKDAFRKMGNRRKGIAMAVNKISEEEAPKSVEELKKRLDAIRAERATKEQN